MKQRDTFTIGVIAIVVAIAGWILTNQFINTPENKKGEVEKVEAFSTEFNDEAVQILTGPNVIDFTRDPNLDAGGSDHTLDNKPEGL